MSRALRVAVAPAPAIGRGAVWRNREVTWDDFPGLLGVEHPADVKDCGGLFGGALREERPDNKVTDNVEVRTVLYLDADRADRDFLVDLLTELGDYALLWHTTFQHTEEAPRYRVYLPASRGLSGEEAELVTLALMDRLGMERFDRSCAEPSRMMYLASARDGAFQWGRTDSRRPLPVQEWLDAAEAAGLAEGLRLRRASRGSLEPADAPPTPGQRDKAWTILRKYARQVEEQAREIWDGRDNALIHTLPTLYRLALGGCFEREEVDDLMREAALAADGPDQWTPWDYNRVAQRAWALAEEDGGGLPTADDDLADDFGGAVALPAPPSPRVQDLFTPSPARFLNRGQVEHSQLTRYIDGAMPLGKDALARRLMTYRGGVWHDGERDVSEALHVILHDAWRPERRNSAMENMRDNPHLPVIAREPVSPGHVNVLNGMLRWEDGVLEPHDAALRSTVQVPHAYDPAARCPEFDEFLATVMSHDADRVAFVWELLGYLLYSGNPLHKMVMLWGPKGRNGKGTLLRVVNSLLGGENVSAVDLHSLAEDKFKVAELYGRLVNVAGDIDAAYLERTALLKALTGGDTITADRKYGQPFVFTPWAVPVFSANEMFGVNETSEAWFKRWLVVPFFETFHGREDPTLEGRLHTPEELQGVLAGAVRGLRSLMARGRFEEPEAVVEARRQMALAGDSVRRWVDEHCEMDPDAWTRKAAVWERYVASVDTERGSRMQKQKFNSRLLQIQGITAVRRRGVDGLRGLRLRTDFDDA